MTLVQTLKRGVPAPIKRLVRKGYAESRLVTALSSHLPRLGCIDVGASYYPHVRWQLMLESVRTEWIAVEPNVANIEYVRSWRWPSTVAAVTTGLSEHGGEQILHITNVDSGSSLLEPVIADSVSHRFQNRDYFFPFRPVRIETLTLRQVTDRFDQDLPLCVKLDTQGTELSILRGAQAVFDAGRFVGIEMEATLLAQPVMQGSGKFWEACKYLEEQGFELLQFKPIPGPSRFTPRPARGNTFLNECDAVFAIRRDVAARRPPAARAALLAFYLSYRLFEEGLALLEADEGLRSSLAGNGCDVDALMSLIRRLA
jgi:FkbM family methyltransferase